MAAPFLQRNYAIVTAVIIAVILYGSFFPFEFRLPEPDIGPVHTLLASWGQWGSRGDLVSNVLLYMPLGFFGVLALNPRLGFAGRVLLVTLLGFCMCVGVELGQYYDEGRDTTLSDVCTNTLGSTLGAIIAVLFGGTIRWGFLRDIKDNREPALLLAAWLGYWLYPYIPVIDLHKYWDALKPVVLHPSLTPYDLFRHTATWLAIYLLFATVFRRRYPTLLLPFFVGAVLVARIPLIDAVLSVGEIAGAVLGFALWILLGANQRLRVVTITLLFFITVAAERLEPFQFGAGSGQFQWIPFYGFMQGSIDIDVQSFCQKFFMYGGLIWLLVASGMRLLRAAFLVAALLFVTSWMEIDLPGRSAEITDAVMALAIAAIAGLAKPSVPRPAPLT